MSRRCRSWARSLFGTFLIGVPGILIWSWLKGSRAEFQMMVVAMVLIVFNVVFWTLFEQAGSSLTLFADRNTGAGDRLDRAAVRRCSVLLLSPIICSSRW